MSMRSSCRYLRAHTYSSGRVVERCALNWAPAAPCDCPVDCERFAAKIDLTVAAVIDLRGSGHRSDSLDLVLDLSDAGDRQLTRIDGGM